MGKQSQRDFPLTHRKVYVKYRVKKISSFDNMSWKNKRSKGMRKIHWFAVLAVLK